MTNRRGIPDEVKIVTNREEFSQTIHFEEGKKDLALCSYHVKTKLGITRDGKKKPALYKFYYFSKGGTDSGSKNFFLYVQG